MVFHEELPNVDGNDASRILWFGISDDCVRKDRSHTKVAPIHDVRKFPPAIDTPKNGFVLRQDLFDRNNPNNLRSDWPALPCSTGPVLKSQRRSAIISEISEALRTFGEFDCLWPVTTRVELLFIPHTRLVDGSTY